MEQPGGLADPVLVAAEARASENWEVLEQLWLHGLPSFRDRDRYRQLMLLFSGLPDHARKWFPLLSWAAAAAAAELDPVRCGKQALSRRVLKDALTLHSEWRQHQSLDRAVLAGTMWMICQRQMPAATGSNLEAAWGTRQAVRELISERQAQGVNPSPFVHTIFAAFSAQLALARADLQTVLSEVRLAQLLDGAGAGIGHFVRGLGALGDQLAGQRAESPRVRSRSIDGHYSGVADLRNHGIVMSQLAAGLAAMQRCDATGLGRILAEVTPEMAFDAHCWVLRVYLEASLLSYRSSPGQALEVLDSARRAEGLVVHELEEPFGRWLFATARVELLNQLGATGAATETLHLLPPGGIAPEASVLLWKGNLEQAVRVARKALYEPDTAPRDRRRLMVIEAAALVLDVTVPKAISGSRAYEAVRRCLDDDALAPLAMIPAGARALMFDSFVSRASSDELRTLERVRDRVEEMPTADVPDTITVRLTRREQALLPLLATSDPIPSIARDLGVATATVRKQAATLRAKFAVNSRAELIRKARASGLLH